MRTTPVKTSDTRPGQHPGLEPHQPAASTWTPGRVVVASLAGTATLERSSWRLPPAECTWSTTTPDTAATSPATR